MGFLVERRPDIKELLTALVNVFADIGDDGKFVRGKLQSFFKVFFAPNFLKAGFGLFNFINDVFFADFELLLCQFTSGFDIFEGTVFA